MTDKDQFRDDLADSGPTPALYALSVVVYAERGDEILLLKRAEGAALAVHAYAAPAQGQRDTTGTDAELERVVAS